MIIINCVSVKKRYVYGKGAARECNSSIVISWVNGVPLGLLYIALDYPSLKEFKRQKLLLIKDI